MRCRAAHRIGPAPCPGLLPGMRIGFPSAPLAEMEMAAAAGIAPKWQYVPQGDDQPDIGMP